MNIPEHRKAIDKFDAQIVKLLNERTKHVLAIGEIKRKAGEEIYAPHRERAVLQRICRRNQGPITNESLRAIYREIMSSALSLEKSLTVAYLGPGGDLHPPGGHPALRLQPALLAAEDHRRCLHRGQQAPRGLRRGPGGELHRGRGHAHARHVRGQRPEDRRADRPAGAALPAEQLPALADQEALRPSRNRSANAATGCRANLPRVEIIETSSNARSAELAASEKGAAAIAGVLAAEKYDVPVLEYDIQDNVANATRFLVLGRQCSPPTGQRPHEPDVQHRGPGRARLYSALAAFRRYRINMTKIESRPSKRKAWEYFFFVDCDGHVEDRKVAKAISLLGEHCSYVKVLGSYPNSE